MSYDYQQLASALGLELTPRDLFKPDDKPHFVEIVGLKKTLNELKQHRNKARIVSLSGTIDNGITKLEKVEEELRRSQLDASELAQVPVGILKNLEECMNVTVVQTALMGNEEQVRAQLAAIEKTEEIRNLALSDGEMAIAEEQFVMKAQLLERLGEVVQDKFRIIGQTDDEIRMFAKIHDVQKKAFQETAAIKDAKRLLKQRCEADLAKMGGSGGDPEAASKHKQRLELTIFNCDIAIRCISIIEELVTEGCSAVKARFDRTVAELSDVRFIVHKEYLEAFRRFYKTVGQLVYKKERRLEEIDRNIRTTHIQLEFCIETFDPNAKKHSDTKKDLYKLRTQVEEELEMLKDKMATALEAFGPTEDALIQAGIDFVHPAEEVEDNNLSRRTKMVEYKAHLSKQEEVKIAAEREEIRRAKVIRSTEGSAPRAIRDQQ